MESCIASHTEHYVWFLQTSRFFRFLYKPKCGYSYKFDIKMRILTVSFSNKVGIHNTRCSKYVKV